MRRGAAPGQTSPATDGPDPYRVVPPGIPARTSTETRLPAEPARAPPDRRRGLGGRGTGNAFLRFPRERCRAQRTDGDGLLEMPEQVRIRALSGTRCRVRPPRPSRPSAWES